MKSRLIRTCAVVGATVAVVLLFATSLSLAAPIEDPLMLRHAANSTARHADGPSVNVDAARAISIPFGIDSSLLLTGAGRRVVVTGHGDCKGGERYEVRVIVKQFNRPTVVAHGATNALCPTNSFEWVAEAANVNRKPFVVGEAEVCAFAQVENLAGRSVTKRWCKNALLTTEGGE